MTGLKLTTNWTPVPNDILKKAGSMGFSAQEQKVFWFIIQQTLGFETSKDPQTGLSIRKTKQTLSYPYINKSTGVPIRTVRGAIDNFVDQRIIFVTIKTVCH